MKQWVTTRRLWQDPDLKFHYWELVEDWKYTGIIVRDFTKYPDCEVFDWNYINTTYGSEKNPKNKEYIPNYKE